MSEEYNYNLGEIATVKAVVIVPREEIIRVSVAAIIVSAIIIILARIVREV